MGRRATWFALALLLAATAAAYLPSIDGDFVLDDQQLLVDPLVAAPLDAPLSAWLAAPRPVLTASFALNQAAVGLDTRGWHLTNLAIHLAAVLLAWRLARRLLRRAGLADPEGPALAAAGLFALHPLQTEAVSYVTQRGESLASALFLAALLLLLRRDEAPAARRAPRSALLLGAGALLLLGLLVKPIVATLPLAWLLAAALLPPAAEASGTAWTRVRQRLPAAAPLLALGLASALWTLAAAAGSDHAGFGMPDVSAATYLATQLRVIPAYLARLAWPAGQCADCEVPWSGGLLDPAALAGGAFLAAALALALRVAHRARAATGDAAAAARLTGFGLAFFLLLLAPTSSVVPLRDPLAEHRLYLASLGLFLAAAAAVAAGLRRLGPARAAAAGLAAAAILLAALGLATARRNAVWAGALAFHRDAAATAPGKARVHLNLGAALMAAQRFEEALASFRRAQALEGDRTVSPRLVFENLTGALLATGRGDEARAAVQDVLRTEGDDPWARAVLAEIEYVAGRRPEAEAAARAALAREPGHPKARKYLGLTLAQRGDFAGAVVPLRAAAEAGTADPALFYWLAVAEAELGDRPEACRALAYGASLPSTAAQAERAQGLLARLGCR